MATLEQGRLQFVQRLRVLAPLIKVETTGAGDVPLKLNVGIAESIRKSEDGLRSSVKEFWSKLIVEIATQRVKGMPELGCIDKNIRDTLVIYGEDGQNFGVGLDANYKEDVKDVEEKIAQAAKLAVREAHSDALDKIKQELATFARDIAIARTYSKLIEDPDIQVGSFGEFRDYMLKPLLPNPDKKAVKIDREFDISIAKVYDEFTERIWGIIRSELDNVSSG